jgi:hypothetical protein
MATHIRFAGDGMLYLANSTRLTTLHIKSTRFNHLEEGSALLSLLMLEFLTLSDVEFTAPLPEFFYIPALVKLSLYGVEFYTTRYNSITITTTQEANNHLELTRSCPGTFELAILPLSQCPWPE